MGFFNKVLRYTLEVSRKCRFSKFFASGGWGIRPNPQTSDRTSSRPKIIPHEPPLADTVTFRMVWHIYCNCSGWSTFETILLHESINGCVSKKKQFKLYFSRYVAESNEILRIFRISWKTNSRKNYVRKNKSPVNLCLIQIRYTRAFRYTVGNKVQF